MTTITICEKGLIAEKVRDLVPPKLTGDVYAASGHLLRLKTPEEYNPDWKRWDMTLLYPENGSYPLCPTGVDYQDKLLKNIGDALKSANRVIIATDPDREGQMIGDELLDYFNFQGPVDRVKFLSERKEDLIEAFESSTDNKKERPLTEAAMARANADQIMGLTLTRAFTYLFSGSAKDKNDKSEKSRALGIGRVKSPTMGLVCKRELEIKNFISRPYQQFYIDVDFGHGNTISFECRDDDFITKNIEDAKLLEGRLLTEIQDLNYMSEIETKIKKVTVVPPKPHHLASLQKAAGKLNWSPDKTLNVLQSLYSNHELVTYPRCETRYLPESMIETAKRNFQAVLSTGRYDGLTLVDPVIRTGGSGVFCDKKLSGVSHYAIIPCETDALALNKKLEKLDSDESALYWIIVDTFIQSLQADAVKHDITLSLKILNTTFEGVGSTLVQPGHTVLEQNDKVANADDKISQAVQTLQSNDNKARISSIYFNEKKTRAPKRYKETSIPDLLENAWKLVEDEEASEKLKETKGIGRPATRHEIVKSLIDQGYLSSKNGILFATPMGLSIYEVLEKHAPSLLDIKETAFMENALDRICKGEISKADYLEGVQAKLVLILNDLSTVFSGEIKSKTEPTEGQIKLLERLKQEGVDLGDLKLTDRRAVSAFIDQHIKLIPPSEGQLKFAAIIIDYDEKLSSEIDLNADNLTATDVSQFIQKYKKILPKRKISPRQAKRVG